MSLSDNMLLIRKKKGLSQADLGKMIGTSGEVVGRYERGDITPSVEVVSKIADALEVSVDYLLGKTKMELDKQALKRLEDISTLAPENKKFVLNLIDMALRDFKTKRTYAGQPSLAMARAQLRCNRDRHAHYEFLIYHVQSRIFDQR